MRRLNRILPCLCLCLLLVRQGRAQSHLPTGNTNTNTTRARVVIVQDPAATDDFQPVPDKIQLMVDRGITNLTGKATVSAAWLSLVSTNDTIGLKVFSSPGPNSGTRPAVAAAVVQDLLAAGVPPRQIIIWDKRSVDLRLAGFYDLEQRFGIRVLGSVEAGYDPEKFYERAFLGRLSWTDLEFGQEGPGIGRKSYVSKLLTHQITKIINLSPLIHNNFTGVSGNLYSLALGSVDNTLRFENAPSQLAEAVPEIYALPSISDRVVLNIVDALVCQYEGQERSLLHYAAVLNELRFSRDPVALDTLSLSEINRQREAAGTPAVKNNSELLPNAAILELGVNDVHHIDVEKLP